MTLTAPTATLTLCDFANNDRGKWNVLGAGWTRCAPSRDIVFAFATLQLPPGAGSHEMEIEAAVWDVDLHEQEGAKPEASMSLSGDYDVREGDREPPSLTLHVALPIQVSLQPETSYIVELRHNGRPLAWSVFQVAALGEDL